MTEANSKEVIISELNFESEVIQSDIPVLVDFWAEWCGPCKIVGPILSELATLYEGKFKIAKLNVDDIPNLAGKYDVRSIPTMKFFVKGQVVDEIIGAAPKNMIVEKMLKYIT